MAGELKRVIVALDFPSADTALAFVDRLQPGQVRLKVGFELFVAAGPDLVSALVDRGFDVFLDLKFHDIPNTVAAACRAAARLGVWMLNIHAAGGRRMMEAAREALESTPSRPHLIAVTVLTSMVAEDLRQIGHSLEPAALVDRYAGLAHDCGLDGVVCSAREATLLRQRFGKDFLLVTPGIRPKGTDAGDQSRIMDPASAIAAGSSYLVIGRPVTRVVDPSAVLSAIQFSLETAGV